MILRHTIIVPLIFIAVQHVWSANNTNETDDALDTYDPTRPYCFRFTWLGNEFDNTSRVNTTCADYLDSTRAVGVPCRQPLVYTYDATPPDMDFLWAHHRQSVICKRSRGQVCAKYSYSYNNEIQNVTYMCTKVSAKGEGAITSGCYKQIVNEYEVELCLCESGTGPYPPCNSALRNFLSMGLMIILCMLLKSL